MAKCNLKQNAIRRLKDMNLIDDNMKVISSLFFTANAEYTNSAKQKYGVKNEGLMFDTEYGRETPRLERVPYYRTDEVKSTDIIAVPNDEFFKELQERFDEGPVQPAEGEEVMPAPTLPVRYNLDLNPMVEDVIDADTKKQVMDAIGAVKQPVVEQEFVKVKGRLDNYNKKNNMNLQLLAEEDLNGKITVTDVLEDATAESMPDDRVMDLINRMREIFPQINYEFITQEQVAEVAGTSFAVDNTALNAFVKNGTVYLVLGRFTDDMILEEFLHPFVDSLRIENPELFNNLLTDLRSSLPSISEMVNNTYTMERGFTQDDREAEMVTRGLQMALANKLYNNYDKPYRGLRKILNDVLSYIKDLIRKITGRPAIYTSAIASETSVKDLVNLLVGGPQIKLGAVPNVARANLTEDERNMINEILEGATEDQKTVVKTLLDNNIVYNDEDHSYVDLTTLESYRSVTSKIKGSISDEGKFEFNRNVGSEFDFIMNAVALNRDWDFIEGQLRYINVETARQFYDVFMNYMHAWRGTGTIVIPQLILGDSESMTAGKMDLLLIDPNGVMDIIDLKTSLTLDIFTSKYDFPYQVESEESVFYGGKLSTRQQHGVQQHAYKRMIDVNPRLAKYTVRSVKTMHFIVSKEMGKITGFEFQDYVDHTLADYTEMVNKVIPTQPVEKNRVFRTLSDEQSRPENREKVENIRTIIESMIDKFAARRKYFEEIADTTRGKTVASQEYMDRLSNIIGLMRENMLSGSPVNAFYNLIKYINNEVKRHSDVINNDKISMEKRLSYMLEAEKDMISYKELLFNPDNFLNNASMTKLAGEAASTIDNTLMVIQILVKDYVKDFVGTRTSRDLTAEELEQIVEQAEDISWDQMLFGDIANSKDAILANLDKAYKANRQAVLDFVDRLAFEITEVGNEVAKYTTDKLRMFDFMLSTDDDGNITGYIVGKIGKKYWQMRREIREKLVDGTGATLKYRPVYNIDGSVSQEDLDFNVKLKDLKDQQRKFNEAEMLDENGNVVDGVYHKYTEEFKRERAKNQYLFKKLDENNNVLFYEWRRRSGVSDKAYNTFLDKYYNQEVTFLSPVPEKTQAGSVFKGRVTERSGRFVKNDYVEIREIAGDGTDMRDEKYRKMMEATDPLGVAQRNFYEKWMALYDELLKKLPVAQAKEMRNRLPVMEGAVINNVKSKGEGFVKAFAKGLRSLNPFTIDTYSETVLLDEDGNIRKSIPIFYVGDTQSKNRIAKLEARVKEVAQAMRDDKSKDYNKNREELKKLRTLLRVEKSKISKDQLSTDMVRNIINFAHMSETYQVMSNFESSVQAILRTMKMRKYIRRSDAGNVVTSKLGSGLEQGTAALFGSDNALAVQRLEKWMDMVFYGTVNPFKSKWGAITRKLMRYMSLKGVGLNVFGQLNNYMMGNVNNAIEAAGDRYFSRQGFLRAIKEYNTDYLPGQIAGNTARKLKAKSDGNSPYYEMNVSNSKYEALARKYRMMRKMLSADLGGDFTDRALDAAYFLQEGAEYNIQTKTGNAILMTRTFKNKKTGEEVSIYDAHSFNQETGQVELDSELYEETDQMRFDTTNYIYEVNKSIHGNYAYEDRMVIQSTLLGELVAQFHKWMYPFIKQQWGVEYYNENLGEVEGRFRTGVRLIGYIYDMRSVSDGWNMLSPAQRANMYKLLAFTAFFLGSLGMTLMLARFGDDDDDELLADRTTSEVINQRLVNLFIYQFDRLQDEISAAVNPKATMQFVKNPIALEGFIDDAMEALGSTFNFMLPPINSESDYFTKGVNKGRLKLEKEWGDLVPIWQQYNRWRSFDAVKSFYVQ